MVDFSSGLKGKEIDCRLSDGWPRLLILPIRPILPHTCGAAAPPANTAYAIDAFSVVHRRRSSSSQTIVSRLSSIPASDGVPQSSGFVFACPIYMLGAPSFRVLCERVGKEPRNGC